VEIPDEAGGVAMEEIFDHANDVIAGEAAVETIVVDPIGRETGAHRAPVSRHCRSGHAPQQCGKSTTAVIHDHLPLSPGRADAPPACCGSQHAFQQGVDLARGFHLHQMPNATQNVYRNTRRQA